MARASVNFPKEFVLDKSDWPDSFALDKPKARQLGPLVEDVPMFHPSTLAEPGEMPPTDFETRTSQPRGGTRPQFPKGTPRDIRPAVEAPEQMGVPERAGKKFINELILSDIERGRPTSAIARGLPALERTFKGFEKAGIPPSKEMTFLDYINPVHYGRAGWEMLKGFYAPKSRKEQEQAHQALKQYRGAWEFSIPVAETTGEKVTDVAAGLGAFVTRLIAAKKILPSSLIEYPNIQSALAFELVNTEGLPGTGLATSGVLRGIAQIPASTTLGKAGKIGLASTALGGVTAARGGSKEDIAIAAMIPVAMAAIGATQNKISDVKLAEHLRYKFPFMRDVSWRNSLKYTKALRQAYQIKHGKLSPEQWSKRVNQWSKNNAKNLDAFFKEASEAFKKAGPQAAKQITGKARLEAGLEKQVRVSPEVAKKAADLIAKGVSVGEVDKMLSIAKATGEMPPIAPEPSTEAEVAEFEAEIARMDAELAEIQRPAQQAPEPPPEVKGEIPSVIEPKIGVEKAKVAEELAAQRGAFQEYQKSMPDATEQETIRFMIEDGLRPSEAVLKRNEEMPEVKEIRAQDKTEEVARKAATIPAITPAEPPMKAPPPATKPEAKAWTIINSRGQQLGKKTFSTREEAQRNLEKRITSPIARTQFSIQPITPTGPTAVEPKVVKAPKEKVKPKPLFKKDVAKEIKELKPGKPKAAAIEAEELRRDEAIDYLADTSGKFQDLEDRLMEIGERDPHGTSAEYKEVDAKMDLMVDAYLARQKKPPTAKAEPLKIYKAQVKLPNKEIADYSYQYVTYPKTGQHEYSFNFKSKTIGHSSTGIIHHSEKAAVVDAAGGPVKFAEQFAEQRYTELKEAAAEKAEPKTEGMKKYPPGKTTNIEKQTGSDGAIYKIVEAADLIPSHNAVRFGPRKDYPAGVQERQYQTDKTEQIKVIEAAQDFKPEFLISDNPDAINGPPIVDVDGTVIGGNSRTLVIQRVYKTIPKSAERYKKLLQEKAAQFGVNPKTIQKMKEPVLVRELTRPPADIDDIRRLAREYNMPLTHGLSATADAVSRAKNLSSDTLDMVGVMLAKDESITVRDLLRGVNNSIKITRSLQADGVITEREINRYIDPRTQLLNEEGKTLVEKILLGKVIDDPALLSNIPHGVQRKIERALPYLTEIKARGGKWDISDSLKTALEGYAYWDKTTQTLEDFLDFQRDLFGESPIRKDPKAQALMRLLEMKNSREIKAAFAKYAEKASRDIRGQERLAFAERPSPEKTFNEVFGKPKEAAPPKGLFKKTEPGFVYVPRNVRQMIRDIIHLGQHGIIPAQSRWKKLGVTGKKLVARAIRAEETAQMRSSQANEEMHDITKGLTRKEKQTFGYAVNYIAWERTPKEERKRRGYKLRGKPISKKQRIAAEKFLELSDWGMQEYSGLGGMRRFKEGGRAEIKGGGIPWPQRFTKEGLELYAEVMAAKDNYGRPNFDALRENALVKAMVEDGIAEDIGDAWRKISKHQENRNRPLYGYFETEKTPLPAKYMTFDSGDVLGHNFWLKMYRTIEMARQFGIHYQRAYEYLGEIELEHGKDVKEGVEKWFDQLTGKAEMNLTEAQRAGRRIAYGAGNYQLFKLSPLTSLQNFFQRFLSLMEYGPIKTIPPMFKAYTPKARREARMAGAIPFDPFSAGIVGDLRSGEGRAFARAWIEGIGMGVTERGNNYTAATVAGVNVMKDLEALSKHKTKLGQVAKSILSLGGESPGAIQRRLRRHGINWKKALARGYLTPDELHLAALREAKSKHFRSDLFTTPAWWQQSPWARQFLKYKVPFAYNMLTQVAKLAGTEAAHGNIRPALAFLVVTCIAGEIYNDVRGVLFGERRDDITIGRRILENLMDGGALGLFTSFMFGRTIVEAAVNFVGGVWLKTGVNVTRVADNIIEAPEHTKDHILQFVNREIPAWKYITNVVHREDAKSRFQRRRIRWEAEKEFTKREGDRFYYYNDLYSAIENKDRKEAQRIIGNLGRLGANVDSTMAALEARRPSVTPLKKRPAMLRSLNRAQLEMMQEEEKSHDFLMARAHKLLKDDYYQWIGRQIETAQSTKALPGERERAKTRLGHLGIKTTQYRTYLRRAEKERKAQQRKEKSRTPFKKKAG